MSYTQVVPRICMLCGRLPCTCPIGTCSVCGTKLNLDAIGESLTAWNLKHQSQMGCVGFVRDPRIKGGDMSPQEYQKAIEKFAEHEERRDREIKELNSQIEKLIKDGKK